MAPLNFGLALFGDAADPSLPDTIQPNTRGVDTAFERFIDGALTKLYNESSARTEDGRALRASCKPLLGADPAPFPLPQPHLTLSHRVPPSRTPTLQSRQGGLHPTSRVL